MKPLHINRSVLYKCFKVFNSQDQTKIALVSMLQVMLSILDLIGVFLVGAVGALAVRSANSQKPGDRVSALLEFFQLETLTSKQQIIVIGLAAAIFLVFRTLLSAYFSHRSLVFLSRKSSELTSSLLSKLLAQPILKIKNQTSTESLYALTDGVSTLTLGVIGSLIILISDMSLLAVMAFGLLYVDPMVACTTFIIFGAISLTLYKFMHIKALRFGSNVSEMSIKSNEKILEILNSYREAFVRNRRVFYSNQVSDVRSKFYSATAEIQFLPNLSKYIIEVSVVLGTILIGFVQFSSQDSSRAIANLLVFMAAGSRIAPAVLRVQQNAVAIKVSRGRAEPTLRLIEQLHGLDSLMPEQEIQKFDHTGFLPEITVKDVSFRYPGNATYAIKNINLSIIPGTTTAIVGSSGAGKTTLADILLGVITPTEGSVFISGVKPIEAIQKWPGSIGYVPQQTFISNGSIADNIKMGFQSINQEKELIENALSLSHLNDFIESLPLGVLEKVGDGGNKLSGGQKQRLGIARALFTSPLLLVLDEATSSLDGLTEDSISNSIKELKGKVTVVLIAHRLSTVRNADHVIFLQDGEIKAEGTFEEVRLKSPDFDNQAKLMGL